ncbi:MAG TPA: DUF2147 domain-containing protein [Sphingobium sp.]
MTMLHALTAMRMTGLAAMRVAGLAAMGVALVAMPSAARAQTVTGDWLTDDGSAIIHVAMRGAHLWGTIARVLDPAAPAKDIRNPDPAARTRPLVGTAVLLDFTRSSKGWDNGRAYDPKAGRSYRSTLALNGADRLDVTGCVLFLCRTKSWTRAR